MPVGPSFAGVDEERQPRFGTQGGQAPGRFHTGPCQGRFTPTETSRGHDTPPLAYEFSRRPTPAERRFGVYPTDIILIDPVTGKVFVNGVGLTHDGTMVDPCAIEYPFADPEPQAD